MMGASTNAPKPGMKRLSFNLLDQLTFYGSYHNNPINQLIHFVFVPGIMFSILVWLARYQFGNLGSLISPFGVTIPTALQGVPVSASALMLAVYSLFYLGLDFFAGLSWGLCIGAPLCWGAHALRTHPQADTIAAVLQVVSWYMQVGPMCSSHMHRPVRTSPAVWTYKTSISMSTPAATSLAINDCHVVLTHALFAPADPPRPCNIRKA